MRKIFQEYGGVIVTVIAVVSLIALVTLLMSNNGVMYNAFSSITQSFVDEAGLLVDNAVGENGGSGGETSEPDEPTGVYDDTCPIEWNSLAVATNPTIEGFVKISNLTPTAEEMATYKLFGTVNGTTIEGSLVDSGNNTYVYQDDEQTTTIVFVVLPTSESYVDDETGETITLEAGLYATAISGTSVDFELRGQNYVSVWSDNIANILAEYEENENSTTTVQYISESVYNGVSLPSIPEDGDVFVDLTWDSVNYPYFIIVDGAAVYSSDYPYILLYSSTPFTVNADNEFVSDGTKYMLFVKETGAGVWNSLDVYPSSHSASALVWSNHDVIAEDGTVYLAATDPVFVSKTKDTVCVKLTDQIYSADELEGAKLVGELDGEQIGFIGEVEANTYFVTVTFSNVASLMSDSYGFNVLLGGDGSTGVWLLVKADQNYSLTLYLQEQ